MTNHATRNRPRSPRFGLPNGLTPTIEGFPALDLP